MYISLALSAHLLRLFLFLHLLYRNIESQSDAAGEKHDKHRKQSAVSGAHFANNSGGSTADSTSDNEDDGSDSVTASTGG